MDSARPTLDLQQILNSLAASGQIASGRDEPIQNDAPTSLPVHDVTYVDRAPNAESEAQRPRSRPQTRSLEPIRPTIDPATITTWQAGLRCVTKIAAENTQFAASIRTVNDNFSSVMSKEHINQIRR